MNFPAAMENKDPFLQAVVHFDDGTLAKGFLDDAEGLVRQALASGKGSLPELPVELQLVAGGRAPIDLSTAKAVFFVKTFEGSKEYKEVKFFQSHPEIAGLWVRVRFFDDEVSEGIVHNSLTFLEEPGFFMKPPDPQSNNRMVYVLKKSLVDFQVLGIQLEF
ncbi:MAG TPA: hypothetical protein VNW97_05150 [Candidatus Saccharimonadales bacterium]|nr:hypothetical protein [Candidatus Saccharimonadales bacterium]